MLLGCGRAACREEDWNTCEAILCPTDRPQSSLKKNDDLEAPQRQPQPLLAAPVIPVLPPVAPGPPGQHQQAGVGIQALSKRKGPLPSGVPPSRAPGQPLLLQPSSSLAECGADMSFRAQPSLTSPAKLPGTDARPYAPNTPDLQSLPQQPHISNHSTHPTPAAAHQDHPYPVRRAAAGVAGGGPAGGLVGDSNQPVGIAAGAGASSGGTGGPVAASGGGATTFQPSAWYPHAPTVPRPLIPPPAAPIAATAAAGQLHGASRVAATSAADTAAAAAAAAVAPPGAAQVAPGPQPTSADVAGPWGSSPAASAHLPRAPPPQQQQGHQHHYSGGAAAAAGEELARQLQQVQLPVQQQASGLVRPPSADQQQQHAGAPVQVPGVPQQQQQQQQGAVHGRTSSGGGAAVTAAGGAPPAGFWGRPLATVSPHSPAAHLAAGQQQQHGSSGSPLLPQQHAQQPLPAVAWLPHIEPPPPPPQQQQWVSPPGHQQQQQQQHVPPMQRMSSGGRPSTSGQAGPPAGVPSGGHAAGAPAPGSWGAAAGGSPGSTPAAAGEGTGPGSRSRSSTGGSTSQGNSILGSSGAPWPPPAAAAAAGSASGTGSSGGSSSQPTTHTQQQQQQQVVAPGMPPAMQPMPQQVQQPRLSAGGGQQLPPMYPGGVTGDLAGQQGGPHGPLAAGPPAAVAAAAAGAAVVGAGPLLPRAELALSQHPDCPTGPQQPPLAGPAGPAPPPHPAAAAAPGPGGNSSGAAGAAAPPGPAAAVAAGDSSSGSSSLVQGAIAALAARHLLIPFAQLQFGNQVGEGGFGKVYHARWQGREVAVKLLSSNAPPGALARLKEQFVREVTTMSSTPDHPNVLKLLGVCIEGPHLALVTEYCSRGSLYGLLHTPGYYLSWAEVGSLLLGAARGMAHLHAHHILHRDLKSGNLLVDGAGGVKVADFGLSRLQPGLDTLTGGLGTYQWMAPEVLANQRYSHRADVYSFGIVAWECCARRLPYAGMNGVQAALAVMNKGLRPDMPPHTPPWLAALIRECWAPVAEQRPGWEAVVERLEGLVAAEQQRQKAEAAPQQ